MTAFIVPDDDSGRIITFDVIEAELHESIVEITDHPVEVGINATDHIRPLPDRLSLSAYTTNQPIAINPFTQRGELTSHKLKVPQWKIPLEVSPGSIYRAGLSAALGLFGSPDFSVQVLTFPDVFNAIYETYEVLRELESNGVLLQIVTPIRVYEDMVLERVSAPRQAGDSGVLFGLDVRQLRVVESGQVAAPPVPADDVPGGHPLLNKGGQGAKSPEVGEDGESTDSIAKQISNGTGFSALIGL